MNSRPEQILIYHITDVENLPAILAAGGLHSDAAMAEKQHAVIGYNHIKKRRLKEIRVPCCGSRFVGEFVPFYFCPRSPIALHYQSGKHGSLAWLSKVYRPSGEHGCFSGRLGASVGCQ
jgi:ssDNA thymidine ADP-ribosyltransferase DarT-like protein